MKRALPDVKGWVGAAGPALILLASASGAQACAVCMGAADSPVGAAMNAAIFALLGIVTAVLLGFGGFIFYLVRRAKAPLPPHQELTHLMYREGLKEGSK